MIKVLESDGYFYYITESGKKIRAEQFVIWDKDC